MTTTVRKLAANACGLALLLGALPAVAGAASAPVVITVSPQGDDAASGAPGHPVRSLLRAQQLVRANSDRRNVTVELGAGIYRLEQPLMFGTADGGRAGHKVVWTAAPGARPVISGALRVTGWRPDAAAQGVYVADTPKGLDARDLWADGQLQPRAAIEIARSDVKFTQSGLTLLNPKLRYLADLPNQDRIEVESTGFFTDRFSPVAKITGDEIRMQQPGWDNNLWGYDTMANPHAPELSHLYLLNSLAFLTKPGQWYLDPNLGKLYYRPPAGTDPNTQDVELPRSPFLVSVSGSYDPVRDLTFRNLRFFYTSWLGPLQPQGYADQQSGAFLAEASAAYPADSLRSCNWGCPQFETMRNYWSQIPAAVQVSRAEHVVFDSDVFAHIGGLALGIGNDADANASGIGLGARQISVTRSLFTDLAGGAIVVGGVRREAHHPSDPQLIDRDILIQNNRIIGVSKTFRDNAAVMSTYVDGSKILDNDISDAPYDGIDIGFGWGIQDVGGNDNYRLNMHGYDGVRTPIFQTPTTLRDTLVAGNRVHDVKQWFEDGGAIYNLSANPGAQIRDNYLYDLHGRIGLYLDEGSRAVTLTHNVVDGTGRWLNDNTVKSAYPLRITIDNTAIDNWHNSDKVGGQWIIHDNDQILDDHLVAGQAWPVEARAVMKRAGVEPGVQVPQP